MKLLFLMLITVIKIVLDKGLMLGLILLSVWLKGKSIKNSALEWDKYFLSMKEKFLNRYFIVLYSISTVLSSCIAYVLFNVFGFQNPLLKTILLAIVCIILSIKRYKAKGKQAIKDGLNKAQKSILEEETENV
ncbi:hypothetical protein [Lachnoclostridium sp. An181]|uniref:hypothetical protein n=1 Tax=Lachnoclostridium sp. An181 TaxID=1965575 RepID=UPI000B36E86E|nr:hypothetical protein [Lachnoclostridium sp. An181]OUP48272.1 hypothetical protein B5F18_11715 [Lachnoclostridium sp. An181]